MKIYRILLALFFTIISFNALGYELNISTDKNVLISGEPLYLTISYDGNSDHNPDLEALKNDFQIVSNSVSRSINIVNGNVSQLKQWRIGLIPLKEGKIKIHPIKLDNLISNHLDIEVKETTDTAYIDDSKHNSNAPFLQIKQTSDTNNPYIQQQVTFLVTLYDSIGIRIKNININKESQSDWLVVPLLETPILDKDVINGKHVNVIHYAFAGFPQRSGKIKDPRFIIDGYYLKNNELTLPSFNDEFDLFGFNNVFNQQVPVKMQTNEAFSNVKPIPSDYKGDHWLPVSNLTLNSELKNINNLQQGDAFNQTLTIVASGLHETIFPQIKFTPIDNVKIYPEKPMLSSKVSKGLIETTATINSVYIPNKNGEIIIPSIEIDWFNINTNKMEKSITPEKIIIVNSNPNIMPQPKKHEEISKINSTAIDLSNKDAEKNLTNTNLKNITNFDRYIYYAIAILALILTILFYRKIKYKNKYKNNVIKAIKRHDYKKAREELIVWAKFKFNNSSIKNITDVSKSVNDEDFSKQLSILNKIIYSDTKELFNNTNFIDLFKKIDKIKYSKRINSNPIPQLYN